MNINDDFIEICKYAHGWNWVQDLDIVQKIYNTYPESYSVLTPFAYTYLEELIRSTTSEYGMELLDENGNPKYRRTGKKLIKLAKKENKNKTEYISLLNELEHYFDDSSSFDRGDNRNSVNHGYMHPRFWTKESFEQLIHDIARISKFAGF